ncbi:MAG: hypothetical protein OQK46_05650 [Gammaproteobacteria bacterium]|nr:hypothetical protein [Gammaproteobacteria bacterium]
MTNKINESMLDLFKSEVITQSDKIINLVNELDASTDLNNTYETIINSSRGIKGAAKLVHVEILIPVIEQLENVFSYYQSLELILNKLSKDTIN